MPTIAGLVRSPSSNPTRFPRRRNPAASNPATTDLPTPPLPLIMAIMLLALRCTFDVIDGSILWCPAFLNFDGGSIQDMLYGLYYRARSRFGSLPETIDGTEIAFSFQCCQDILCQCGGICDATYNVGEGLRIFSHASSSYLIFCIWSRNTDCWNT